MIKRGECLSLSPHSKRENMLVNNLPFDPNDITKYHKLDGVEVSTATEVSKFVENVKDNVKRNHTPLTKHEWFMNVRGHNFPVALVGGGPSVKKELDNLKEFQACGFPIVACGSSHDYLVENGIIPDFCTICDPDPISAAYIQKHNEKTKYLLALSCDALVFDTLKDRQIYVWNCRSDEAAPQIQEHIVGQVDILGGCTVGLRTVSIFMTLGFTNIHFWGYDSCMSVGDVKDYYNEHHAYNFATDKEDVGQLHPIRFGDHKSKTPAEDGKYYMCSGYQLAQAMHFHSFLVGYGAAFTPTFHGEGMLGDFYKYLVKLSEKHYSQQAIVNTQPAM